MRLGTERWLLLNHRMSVSFSSGQIQAFSSVFGAACSFISERHEVCLLHDLSWIAAFSFFLFMPDFFLCQGQKSLLSFSGYILYCRQVRRLL